MHFIYVNVDPNKSSDCETIFFPVWKKLCKVEFDVNGGSPIDPITVPEGDPVPRPDDPTLQGFNFVGWQLDGVDYDFSQPVNSDITLRAKWEVNPSAPVDNESDVPNKAVYISFNPNGGTWSDGTTAIKTVEAEIGEVISIPQGPEKEGSSFVYWQGSTYYPGENSPGPIFYATLPALFRLRPRSEKSCGRLRPVVADLLPRLASGIWQ